MSDRLRDLIDLIIGSLDEPGSSGASLAGRANFSRDHLDRLLAAATGETPVGLRRRLLLERAAWQLRSGTVKAAEAATMADYGSQEAFTRAFSRAYGTTPGGFAGTDIPVSIEAPNGIHFHAPAGLLIPGASVPAADQDLSERLVGHHLYRVSSMLEMLELLPESDREKRLRPGFVVLEFDGEESSAADMAENLVFTIEIWVAALDGQAFPEKDSGRLIPRFEKASLDFVRVARRIRDRGAWNDAFVDALCEPPQTFTYGGVIAHVITFGVIRREALAGVLAELGAGVPGPADPIEWEMADSRFR